MFIVAKSLFRAPKSNVNHAEAMQPRVGAEGVLLDVLKGTQALNDPINIFAHNRRAKKSFGS